jgi:hypothetical protein
VGAALGVSCPAGWERFAWSDITADKNRPRLVLSLSQLIYEAQSKENIMSDCLHCDIHDLLETRLQSDEADLTEIAAKVTEVLADLILLAAPADRGMLMADVLANLGEFVLQKGEEAAAGQSGPRRH